MKKLLILLLCVLTAICATFALTSCSCANDASVEVSQTATAQYTSDGISYNKNDDGTLSVVNAEQADEIEIPDTYLDMKVTAVGRSAFKMSKFKKITLPDTVEKIDDFAFCFSSELEEVEIKEGVTSIGTNAFSGCSKLKSIRLPSTLEYIGLFAFDASGLENIVIPKNVRTVDEYAFAECSRLSQVTFEGSKTTIAETVFNTSENVCINAKKGSEVIKTAKSKGIPYTSR